MDNSLLTSIGLLTVVIDCLAEVENTILRGMM